MTRSLNDTSLARQIASTVKGPQQLRDDIADEIADHLACHIENDPNENSERAHDAALHAFGDPNQIARELRAVHRGDMIMLQKITIAVLVVAVLAMTASSYFSYRSSKQTSDRLAETNEKLAASADEIAGMTRSVNALVAAQQDASAEPGPAVAAPATSRLEVFFYWLPDETPAANMPVRLSSFPFKTPDEKVWTELGTYTTDADGWLRVDVTPDRRYRIRLDEEKTHDFEEPHVDFDYRPVVHSSDSVTDRCAVGTRAKHDVRIVFDSELSWDWSRIPQGARLSLRLIESDPAAKFPSLKSRDIVIDPLSLNTITGLLPGKYRASLFVPHCPHEKVEPWLIPSKDLDEIWQVVSEQRTVSDAEAFLKSLLTDSAGTGSETDDESEEQAFWSLYLTDRFHVPNEDGVQLEIVQEVSPEQRFTGILFDGTRDKPIANHEIYLSLINKGRNTHRRIRVNNVMIPVAVPLKTDENGRFAFIHPRPRQPRRKFERWELLSVPWKKPSGGEDFFVYGLGMAPFETLTLTDRSRLYEIDMSKVGEVEIVLPEAAAMGLDGEIQSYMAFQWPSFDTSNHWGLADLNRFGLTKEQRSWSWLLPTADESTEFEMRVNAIVTQDKPETPEVQQWCLYTMQRHVEVKPGQQHQVTMDKTNAEVMEDSKQCIWLARE